MVDYIGKYRTTFTLKITIFKVYESHIINKAITEITYRITQSVIVKSIKPVEAI